MKKFKWWDEDAPTNATGPSVVGTGDDSSTVVVKKKAKIYRRKKRKIDMEAKQVDEARRKDAVRDYRKEYDNYHSQPEQRERNAARLRARRQMEKWGKVKKFDKMDVHHKDNNPLNNGKDNLAVTTQNWNRSEPRLRKEELDEAAITVTFDVEDGKKFKNTLRDFGLRGKDVKGDGGVRGDSVEVKGDSKKLKKLVKDAERTGNILRVHDNGQLKEAAIYEAVSVKEFDSLKKGDTVTIEYKAAMSSGKSTFKVTAKNVVGKARVEKVTLQSIKNPKGVKHFLYKRSTGVTFAQGDMGSQVVSFKKEEVIAEAGRPRGAARIENERFWDLKDEELRYIIKDAGEAVLANPTAKKATQGPGNWSDQLNDAATVLTYRKKKNIKVEEVIDEWGNSPLDQAIPKYDGRRQIPKKKQKKKKKEEVEESINIQERELTSTELKRREEIAQDLSDADFKKRYGDRWKEVKMGVATNMAKKESINEEDPKADKLKARELKVAKAIAAAQLAIAREQERVQKLTGLQNKIKDQATEETIMSKKYLETKKGTLEETALGIWQDAAEEVGKLNVKQEGFSSSLIKKAVALAQKMGGDMTNAVKKIEKMKRGLSKDAAVVDALRLANEQTEDATHKVDGRTKAYREALRRIKVRQERNKTRSKSVTVESMNEGDKEEYQKFFQAALKKFGAKSPAEMDDEKKKKFFDYIEKNWTKDEMKQFSEGELPPALKKAIADKKAKKDDEEDEDKDPVGEANKVLVSGAVDDLRKIVDTKTMGKVSGQKVDLFSASAMVKVYDALNDKNKAKVEKMLKDKRGVMTFAGFAMSQVK
jgi:hypothetical protein